MKLLPLFFKNMNVLDGKSTLNILMSFENIVLMIWSREIREYSLSNDAWTDAFERIRAGITFASNILTIYLHAENFSSSQNPLCATHSLSPPICSKKNTRFSKNLVIFQQPLRVLRIPKITRNLIFAHFVDKNPSETNNRNENELIVSWNSTIHEIPFEKLRNF